jgi:hypothetical protein
LGLPTAHGFCDQNARNSGKSIIPLVPFDSARSGALMHAGIMVLMVVVELLRRARGNFASSSLFATMTGPFPRSTSRTSTRHPPTPPKPTSLMSPTYCSMFPLSIRIHLAVLRLSLALLCGSWLILYVQRSTLRRIEPPDASTIKVRYIETKISYTESKSRCSTC